MKFQRICTRKLPDGSIATVYPFHVCTKGPEDRVFFRDEDDLRTAHNLMPICGKRTNVSIVTDCVLTTHVHAMLLAKTYDDAQNFIDSYKISASRILSKKYGPGAYFQDIKSKPIFLEDNYHVRNTICYVPRNSIDMGIKVDDYRWSAYRALFRKGRIDVPVKKVSEMTARETRAIFKTGDILKDVPWLVTEDGCIEPASYCDYSYAEEAFDNDITYFTRILGLTDDDQMEEELVNKPRRLLSTKELLKEIEVMSIKRYGIGPSLMTVSQKIPLIKSIYYSSRTTPAQLARCFGLTKADVEEILKRRQAGPAKD